MTTSMIPFELMWDEPRALRFLHRLSSFARHVWFDIRGIGSSDDLAPNDSRLLESVVEDIVCVADDAGLERFALVQFGGAGQGPLFAATHPERTSALVLVNTCARYRRAPDYPEGLSDKELDDALSAMSFPAVERVAPSIAGDAHFRRWYERAQRLGAAPDVRRRRLRTVLYSDTRSILGSVQAPTLVVYRSGLPGKTRSRYLADHISEARRVEVEGADLLAFVDSEQILDAIEAFLAGDVADSAPDRVLATVLFTDLVRSTPQLTEMGDRRWRDLIATHDELVRTELDRFRGKEIRFDGDGVLATFDGPGRAIRCACAIRDALGALGLDVRAGLHTGEVELRGDGIEGIAVVIGKRVSSHAGAGEVLVSRTVADLVAGSGIELHDEGERELKGVSGTWRLYSVESA